MSKGVFVTNEQVRLTGSPNVARFLAQCLYWSTKCDLVIQRQGWFYKSRTEWQAETWLSRYQQEKARAQLRNMGILKERKERTNIGIRIWFWVDQALLNVLLNSLADQSINNEAVNNSVELYDSSLTKQSDNCLTGQLDNFKEVEESNSIKENETIVLKTPLNEFVNGENGTMVLDSFNKESVNNSDYDCKEVEVIEAAESDKQEAAASSLPELTNQSDNISNEPDKIDFCEDPEIYRACHPFIYQFLKTRVLTGYDWSETALNLFRCDGFNNVILQDALKTFIDQHGHSILAWYQTNTPIPVKPLNKEDLELAVLISEGTLL